MSRPIACAALALLVGVGDLAEAAQPVMRLFTTEDGLVRNLVVRIRRDRAGRLWFCTQEGLSLFDGEKFTNYTVADGLPHRSVSDFLDSGDGTYWIITPRGLFRFRTRGQPPRSLAPSFTNVPLDGAQYPMRYAAQYTASFFQTHSGGIWLTTSQGLYHIETRDGLPRGIAVTLSERAPGSEGERRERLVNAAIAEDRHGDLWIAVGHRLIRRRPDGRLSSWGTEIGIPEHVRVLMVDREGHLWVGGAYGLGLRVLDIGQERPSVVARYSAPLPATDVVSLFQDGNGGIWVGGPGVAYLQRGVKEPDRWMTFERHSLLGSQNIASIVDDTQGHLWLAVGSVGAARILRQGFRTFTEADGLESRMIVSIFDTRDGKLYAVTGGRHILNELDGQRFIAISPRLPRWITEFGWGDTSVVLKDRGGEWWMATGRGLVRFPRVRSALDLAHTPPKAIYGPAEGLPGSIVLSLFEDRQGDIWVGLRGTLARWDRATESFRDLTSALMAAISGESPTPTTFAQDGAGRIWIGVDYGGLVRYRENRFERIQDGVPAGYITGLLMDRRSRLWITSTGGLGRIDDPAAASPRGRVYSSTEGLASSQIFAVAEDHAGRIYLAGGHGVDRIDPATDVVQHYLTTDGLPPGEIDRLYCDREGAMWFGSDFGLSRHEPESDRPADPPAPVIHSVHVAGVPAVLSDEGERSVTGLSLPAGRDNIEIAFGSVDFMVSHGPRYQYRLLPVDADWRKPTPIRSVQYARLGSGRYTFQVRGINSAGMVSGSVASVAFWIPPPFWQRWWFLLSAATMLFMLGYVAYAYRLRHAMTVQRIRTRLATDLHDDLGSGLAEIAILAEVARQKARHEEGDIMESVAARARELRGTMGDIVWSVDPAGDNLTGVIRRWRQTAVSLLGGVSLAFTAPPEADTDAIVMLPDRRRHLLLLFKEAITNVARHAQATHVLVEVTCRAGRLHVCIRDDGCGFALEEVRSGQGLRSLSHRMEELKGTLEIDSTPRSGTTVEMHVPLQVG